MGSKHFNRWLLSGLGVAALAAAITLSVRADDKDEHEVKMKIDDVPAAVKATIVYEANGTIVKNVDKETDDGKTIYEADALIGKINYEIKVAEDGTLISKKIDKDDDEKEDGDHKDKDKDEKMKDKD
jgi:hypothetical protein